MIDERPAFVMLAGVAPGCVGDACLVPAPEPPSDAEPMGTADAEASEHRLW